MTGAVRRLCRTAAALVAAAAALPLGALARAGAQPWAMRAWCRLAAWALGLRVRLRGSLPPGGALVVVNHVGYLDILALGAVAPGRFLAKAEIARWIFLGAVSRWGGTLFVDRERPRASRLLVDELARRMSRGERLILFAEAGVSPDGTTLQPFRPMLFEAAVRSGRPVVPAAVRYLAPPDPRVWAWIDEPVLWRHLWKRVLGARRVEVEVRFGPALHPPRWGDRKALAVAARDAVGRLLEGPAPGAGDVAGVSPLAPAGRGRPSAGTEDMRP
ncbi:MAG: hypothetical protein Kow0092_02940 [Deferrisomatales bacterium]